VYDYERYLGAVFGVVWGWHLVAVTILAHGLWVWVWDLGILALSNYSQ
jgi:hypothetical protein